MKFYRNGVLLYTAALIFVIAVFSGISFAQFNVSISGPSATTMTAPTGQFNITATVSGNANNLTKIVFYRNDVPYKTLTGTNTVQVLTENPLGQDTYEYRARAFDSQGTWVDSSDIRLTVETPRVYKMGDTIGTTSTSGPSRSIDHTSQIQSAVDYINAQGGGTLYFPCTYHSAADPIATYNIRNTITVPSNVTLQGESFQELGRCQMLWNDVDWAPTKACDDNPGTLLNKPMFRVAGDTARVRFRDLWLYSKSSGRDCYPRSDAPRIAVENTIGIQLNAGRSGQISDIIIENVAITSFTNGIQAIGNSISDIKLRGVRPVDNHRQLYVDAINAYDWDVQNFNITNMLETQAGVEIIRAGAPASYPGENPKFKFLQLNCNGNTGRTSPFCLRVLKHGGLYIKQLHHEGTNKSIIVENIAPQTNEAPIIFEHSVATGEFYDASMKLYLIGNYVVAAPEIAQAGLDEGRLRFKAAGVNATVVDCGDLHNDVTDINGGTPAYEDLQMLFTHSERNRESFFAESNGIVFPKTHINCPAGVPGVPDISKIGDEHFNTGVLPNESLLPYSNKLNAVTCPSGCDVAAKMQSYFNNGGSIYVDGTFYLNQTLIVPKGKQIIGAPGSALVLNTPNTRLLQIDVPSTDDIRMSSVEIRNLALRTTQPGTTGIGIIGDNKPKVGASSDLHFSGLTIEGFDKGLEIARYSTEGNGTGHPMVDGCSLKNVRFVNNQTAASVFSANLSNWNIMNLSMESSATDAFGWYQITAGNSMQNVTCQGTAANPMKHCIKLDMAGTYLTGFKPTSNVENALTFGENAGLFSPPYQSLQFASSVIRNNNFTGNGASPGRVNVTGKTFITSMNNRYQNFSVGSVSQGDVSRVTYCADTYPGGVAYPGLAALHTNLYVGVPTPTRIECGLRPKPWEAVVKWGEYAADRPLVGNFLDDVQEDLVIYREGSPSYFHIKKVSGPDSLSTDWGTVGDEPLIGHFFSNTRAQVVVYRPSTGIWWVKNIQTNAYYAWSWGVSEDIPFVGNFINESSGSVSGDKDEIAVYRPSSQTIWIKNPRSGQYMAIVKNADYGTAIQVGDFLGAGYDQIAQFKNGVWTISDARTSMTYTANFGAAGDIPVSGKYLPGACTQLGVWRPSSQEFFVKDPFVSCGNRNQSMIWGSNNDFGTTAYADDIPLRINTVDGALHRPTAYRPTKGAFPASLANGQWWIHDPF